MPKVSINKVAETGFDIVAHAVVEGQLRGYPPLVLCKTSPVAMVQGKPVVLGQAGWKRACPRAAESSVVCGRWNETGSEPASRKRNSKEQECDSVSLRRKRTRRAGCRRDGRATTEVHKVCKRDQTVQVWEDDPFRRESWIAVISSTA